MPARSPRHRFITAPVFCGGEASCHLCPPRPCRPLPPRQLCPASEVVETGSEVVEIQPEVVEFHTKVVEFHAEVVENEAEVVEKTPSICRKNQLSPAREDEIRPLFASSEMPLSRSNPWWKL